MAGSSAAEEAWKRIRRRTTSQRNLQADGLRSKQLQPQHKHRLRRLAPMRIQPQRPTMLSRFDWRPPQLRRRMRTTAPSRSTPTPRSSTFKRRRDSRQ